MSRTTRSQRIIATAGIFGLVGVLGACSSGSTASTPDGPTSPVGAGSAKTPAASSKTLHLAFTAVDQTPDPAIWYGGLGNEVELALYEGLAKYGQDSTTLEPDLATGGDGYPRGPT
jgi:ABC-type transport system substrate-binding protein